MFEKAIENVRKHRDIKPAITEERKNYLVSQSNYHTRNIFFWKFISHRNEKRKQIFLKKPVYI